MISHRDIDTVAYAKALDRPYYQDKFQEVWWPFWIWRVVAPDEATQSDIFRELILRLINTGCKDVEEMSNLTGLHRDFVLHLLAVMQAGEILDGWEITERGRSELEKGYDHSTNLRAYTVLQDAYSDEIIPRVFTRLNYLDDVDVDGARVSYLKSRGTGQKISPFMLRLSTSAPAQPEINKIYEAIRQHRKDRQKLRQAGFNSAAVELKEGAVDYLDATPEAVYLNLQVYVDPASDRPWCVSDPAGLFPSLPVLNTAADMRLNTDKHFAARIDSLLGVAMDDETLSHAERNVLLEEKIKAQLVSKYSWASQIPLVEDSVLEMLRNYLELFDTPEKPHWKVKSLSSSLQKVCESVIKVVLNPSDNRDEWRLVDLRDKQQIKAIYLSKSRAVDDDFAWYLSSVRSGQIRTAMQSGNHSLRQLIAALILVSPAMIDEIDDSCPGWLHSLRVLAENRNKAGHASSEVLDVSSIENDFIFVEKLLKIIERKIVNG